MVVEQSAASKGVKYVRIYPLQQTPSLTSSLSLVAKPITINVGVGKDQKTFYMHEETATNISDFFAAALRNGWAEKESRIIDLPEEDPAIFYIFARFAYIGKLRLDLEERSSGALRPRQDQSLALVRLAENLQSTAMKDAVCDIFVDLLASYEAGHDYKTSFYRWIYMLTGTRRGLRRLAVDVGIHLFTSQSLDKSVSGDEGDAFLRDLALRLHGMEVKERSMKKSFANVGCKYHDHVAEGKRCYKTMFDEEE